MAHHDPQPGEALTPEEIQALRHLAHDRYLKETARLMGVSVRSAERILRYARIKLGKHTNCGAVAEATACGLISTHRPPSKRSGAG